MRRSIVDNITYNLSRLLTRERTCVRALSQIFGHSSAKFNFSLINNFKQSCILTLSLHFHSLNRWNISILTFQITHYDQFYQKYGKFARISKDFKFKIHLFVVLLKSGFCKKRQKILVSQFLEWKFCHFCICLVNCGFFWKFWT